MTPLLFAELACLAVGAACLHANTENAKGHYWAGLISSVLAIWTFGIAECFLLSTDVCPAAIFVGLPVAIRIALELGLSVSEIISPDLKVE